MLPINVLNRRRGGLGPGVWTQVYAGGGIQNSPGWGGWETRQAILAGGLTDILGDKIRGTLKSGIGNGFTITEAYFGPAAGGTQFNFDGTQVPVTFNGGSTTATVATPSTRLTFDPITYPFTGTADLLWWFMFSGTSDLAFFPGSFAGNQQKNANDHGANVASGYSGSAFNNLFETLEIF